jgi:hypothetical protein
MRAAIARIDSPAAEHHAPEEETRNTPKHQGVALPPEPASQAWCIRHVQMGVRLQRLLDVAESVGPTEVLASVDRAGDDGYAVVVQCLS